MTTEILLVLYCVVIVFASMAGGWLPSLMQMTHLRTQLLMSFVAGLMLGIAMLHLWPHAANSLGSASKAGAATLTGVIAMFLLMRLFHSHDHNVATESEEMHVHHHGEHCGHSHDGSQNHNDHHRDSKQIGWAGMMFGLAIHTLIDGVALAASVVTDAGHGAWMGLAGLGTFFAVALHKPLDAFAITSVMQNEGWSAHGRNMANLAFSLACPIGALMFYFGATGLAGGTEILGWGLAISAGFFICISLSDLLPEVAFHDHDRVKLTVALLVGMALAVGIENLPGHSHETHQHRLSSQLHQS